jgi:hypothetical protein
MRRLALVLLMLCNLFTFSSLALAWSGEGVIKSPKWGTVGDKVTVDLQFLGLAMRVQLHGAVDNKVIFDRKVSFTQNHVIEDEDDLWVRVCVPQSNGLFEVHQWAPYDEYMNYRFDSDQTECDFGLGEFEAYWMTSESPAR